MAHSRAERVFILEHDFESKSFAEVQDKKTKGRLATKL
jgi:hypothetical protein